MPVFTLSLALFCLPVAHTDTEAKAQQVKEVKPPRAKSDQYCLHLSIPNGSGGWTWNDQAQHCEDTASELCDYICRNGYAASDGYTLVTCGTEATGRKQCMIVPPGHLTTDPPTIIVLPCSCHPQPVPYPIRSVRTCCERPRLFPILRRCR